MSGMAAKLNGLIRSNSQVGKALAEAGDALLLGTAYIIAEALDVFNYIAGQH